MKLIRPYSHPSSQTRRRVRSLVLLSESLLAFTLLALILSGQPLRALRAAVNEPPGAKAELPALRGEKAISHLQQQGLYSSLQEAMQAARYGPQWVTSTGIAGMDGAYEMKNPANHLRAYVSASELRVLPMTDEAQQSWQLGLKLASWGHGDNLSAVGAGEVKVAGNRVEITRDSALRTQHSALTEWYENSAAGLEQGFEIAAPESPIGNRQPAINKEPLRLIFELSGSLKAQLGETRQQAGFSDGRTLLVYEKLTSWDAKKQKLASHMESGNGWLSLVVEDEGAEYPLRIDPLLREQTKITASDGAADDQFGTSVAINGDTVVVGAPFDDVGANVDQGSAYVFVRSGTSWAEQAKLTSSDGAASDFFGGTVAISVDTVAVGAIADNVGPTADQGSAYMFVRTGTTWTQQAKVTASDGAASDFFGGSVAISGDTMAVGAVVDDTGFSDQGSAYVFVRSGTSWTQQAKLTALDGAADDHFGNSIAISGDTVVVGAVNDSVGAGFTHQGSAYVFVRSDTTWTQQTKLTASDGAANDQFGQSVAISGGTVVVGASGDDLGANTNQGSAYVFVRTGSPWTQQVHLGASDGAANNGFGHSVAISGDTLVVGAYLFVHSGVDWTERQKLTSSDGAVGVGASVAISGDTVVVGVGNDEGSAYIYGCNWDQQEEQLTDLGEASDQFGKSLVISGDTVVVGAWRDDVGANTDQGSAHVFVRSGATWIYQNQLTASDGAPSDNFGQSVAISGDLVVVGAFADDVGANEDQGSAYVFVRNGTTWTQRAKLTASDGAASVFFGFLVAISGDTVVVGAPDDNVGGNAFQGSAYVFVRTDTTWTQQSKLVASDGASDEFGFSVAISGDTVVVGAHIDSVGSNAFQGSAYVFVRIGTTWTQQAKVTASDGAENDQFGQSVAISGDTLVVGALTDDIGVNGDQGSAYVFVRSGTTWTQQAQLAASDGFVADNFGKSVAISGDTVAVGAYRDDVGANANQGSAYVFVRSGIGWTEQKFTASDGALGDNFGASIAISGDTVVVGAPLNNVGANADQGSAYVFITACNTSPTVAASNVIRQKASAATSAPLAAVYDRQDPIGNLTVSVVSAPTGISITGVTNSNGVISAQVGALCNAALGNNSVVLRVQDSDGATGDVTLYINVTANTAPTLGTFTNTSASVLGSTTVTPTAPPSDNGSIMSYIASSPTFAGALSTDPDTGSITISNARPGGTHNINVTVIDNCGAAYSTLGFVLTVTCQTITVNPATIPVGTAGLSYSQVFTQTGGNGTVSFSLTGTLPTGMSFTSATATLSGTPTQIGSFPVTVTATDANNCPGSRNYTMVISAPMSIWNGSTSSDWNTASNWTPNAVPTTFTDVLIPTAGVTNQPAISAGSSSINAMTIQSSRVLTINSSLELSTAAELTSAGTITGAGKLAIGGATFTQNGSVSIASVEFSAGNHSLAGGGSFASGIATILGGASVTLTSNHSLDVIVINSDGSFDVTGRTLTLTGPGTPIFNSGSFTATGSTIIYQGSISQVVTPNISYNNLTINNAAGVFLSGNTTVNGLLNLAADLGTGSFVLTMPSGGTSTGSGDVIGNVKRTGFTTGGAALSFGNPLNTIQINSGIAPTSITMNLVTLPPFGFSNCVSRTYAITTNGGSDLSATMRLRYKDTEAVGLSESSFELWRNDAPTWVSPAGAATRNTTENWVEETGITQFSPWTIADGTGPICGVLTPNSQFFGIQGSEGSIIVTALAGCSWTAASSVSWLEITSSPSGAGTDIVTYVVRDNFAPVPRRGILTIAGQTFTVVQDSEAALDCAFSISPSFAAFNASGGAGSVQVITEERCAWQAVSSEGWITITSISCGITNGTVNYSVAANTAVGGRNGTITIAGRVFPVKQKGH